MTSYQSDLMRVLDERGFLFQSTNDVAFDALAARQSLPAYIGFDCTAPSLHVGSLVQIMMLRWIQKTGHKPIVLMGSGTTRIGDPTGRDEARKFLSLEDINSNMAGIKRVFSRFIDFDDSPTGGLMVDNAEWLDGLGYLSFLRDVGRHFTINRMLSFDSVKLRLEREQPMTFLEFNYMILQAYDFAELAKRHGCRLQLGGSDQWGNIINGIELSRRMDGLELYGITSPLITKSDGSKMGKTAQGAVWLNEEALSAYDYYQFWRNVPDADVGRFLRLFTELDLAEIAKLEALGGAEINEAKKILAFEATRLARGDDAAVMAQNTATQTFEQGTLAEGLPQIVIEPGRLTSSDDPASTDEGLSILDLYIEAGLAQSRKEVRRLISQGGARLNDQPVEDENYRISADDFEDHQLKLSAGKKRHALVILKSS
ncbi:tyrosine--tRNA ligase [Iodidimonas nitroreducens]|uniref:Tyrosine--tRNA ligase n=1 Tax=Iodidimonas nitroreducens TaxID=1236968 RepID=A0A5A7N3R1_9PROT|nr:tyrosine--tRNA ligase [Iodidimonas nitroreducens]GAK33770.1 tyrosine--tRNA ligase [alpha proteobacterium Q-1]GER02911.1 tyrosine--tRNA ligase [Iodidimonas nitroreducens]